MLALVASAAALFHAVPATAQTFEGPDQYTVWASVIYQRTGERTPEVLGDLPTTLTPVGANQAHSAGSFFRNRYITAGSSSTNASTDGSSNSSAPLFGLNANILDNDQTYVMALDLQWNVATAQAFMQGMYPPWSPGSNSTGGSQLDLTSVTANDTYIEAPLGGYQYPQIRTAGGYDPNFILLSANLDCPAFVQAAIAYLETPEFASTANASQGIYDSVGSAIQGLIPADEWGYWNAYAIWDYLNYANAYNSNVQADLARYKDVDTNTSYLDELRWLASQQQWAQLGNLSAVNPVTGTTGLPEGQTGSISTIAGNMFAWEVLGQLQQAIANSADGAYKLSLLFGDYSPLISFFSIAGLADLNPNFEGMPNFGAAAAFELFSWTNGTATEWPSTDDLWVRFYYRNGTDDDEPFQQYSLFGRGPSQSDMQWSDFVYEMNARLMSEVSDWCTQCGADVIFCAAYNSTLQADFNGGTTSNAATSHGMHPAVAGVIGAVVALVIAGLIFGAAMLLGGVRLRRDESAAALARRKSDLGGFKGGRKMRSDQDLSIPKGGAVVGASVVESPTSPTGGHERVGSWELKGAGGGRPSMEEQGPDPFQDPVRPVRPSERV